MTTPTHNKTLLCILSFFLSISIYAQQKITYNTASFGACETIEAGIGSTGESISVFIAEHELRTGYGGTYERTKGHSAEADNLNDLPKGYTLILDVDFTRNFKFPIEEKDSVYIHTSKMQMDLKETQMMKSYMATQKDPNSAQNIQVNNARDKAKSLEAKAKKIAQQMKEGKISPQEAAEKLTALQSEVTAVVDSAPISNMGIETQEDKPNYHINFIDTKELTESHIFSGILHIIRFNEKEFVAKLYKGKRIDECLEKRAASSREAEKKCKSTPSNLFPDLYILEEGNAPVLINVKLKKFNDFR